MPLNPHHFPLQFITNAPTPEECVSQAQRVLNAGCLWVQLRMKDTPEDVVEETARTIKNLTDEANATLIIDDHVNVCQRINASGVHLGKNDMPPAQARKILGDKFIIGGTCNTFQDILAIHNHVDYIGCGPFRFTTTKKNLAPTLGLDGYRQIVWQCRSNDINTPIVAIGGITVSDIPDILNAGPNGVALSGEIIHADSMERKTQEVIDTINNLHAQ